MFPQNDQADLWFKFGDLNGNGVWDEPPEVGLAGWTITLNNSTYIKTDITNSNGIYSFEGLIAGIYHLNEALPAGMGQTKPTAPGTIIVNLLAHEASTENNFGNYYCNLGVSIGTEITQLNCSGPCPIIRAQVTSASGAGPFAYKWYNNSLLIPGATYDNLTACNPGNYMVNVTNLTAPKCTMNSSLN